MFGGEFVFFPNLKARLHLTQQKAITKTEK